MASHKKGKSPPPTEIKNKKAYHNFHVSEKFEAGIMLQGTEVKSIRAGKAQITEAFVRVEKGVVILYHAHIDEYAMGNVANHAPVRPRKLLLHKRQIAQLRSAVESGGYTIIPTRMYMKGSLIKIEIALCKGKKLFDKRQDLRKKAEARDVERSFKGRLG